MARAAKTVSEKTPHKVPQLCVTFKMLLSVYFHLNSFALGLDLTTTLFSYDAIEDSSDLLARAKFVASSFTGTCTEAQS